MSHRDPAAQSGWPRRVLGEDDSDLPADDEVREQPPASRGPDAARCLVDAALEGTDAADLLERLTAGAGFALVVRVPTAAWVEPLEEAFARLDRRLRIFARDGGSKSHNADVGNEEVGGDLSSGHSVVGIASSISLLPKALAVAADASIGIKVDAGIVADAVARFVGGAPAPEAVEGLGSLDFHDLVSAFRAGSTASEIYARLRRAAGRPGRPREERLPRLVDAVEYGVARNWGLALCREFEEYRAGRIAWSDVSANAVFAGATGLGKTYFARILARELGIELVATSISEIFASSSGFLDGCIKQLREINSRCEASAPCAILWDEFDALPSRASLSNDRSASFWTPVLTEFLLNLDSAGSGERPGLCVWAATNHVERVDPALLRPGRLGRVIHFSAPDPAGISSILRHHLGRDLAGVDLAQLGQIGIGQSPAELAAVVKNARAAARQAQRALAFDDLVDALTPPLRMDEQTLRRVAHHEGGHVVVALALRVDEVVGAAVGGGGDGFGRTLMRRRDGVETRSTIEDRVCAGLGGRAAEAVIYGDCSANAGSDLAAATEAIAGLHASAGLGGGLAYLGDEKAAASMLRVDRILREAVDKDLARLQARAIDIVRAHRLALEAVASALADRRHLTGEQVRKIFADKAPGTPP